MVWNELRGCQRDVPAIPMEQFDEVFALDGGSTDGTTEYLRRQGITVIPQSVRGYNHAYIAAFEYTSCEALVIFHPKGTINPASLKEFRAPFLAGLDLIVASRNISGARNEEDIRMLKPRKWLVLGMSALSALLWWRGQGPIVWDVLHGYRGMRRDAFFEMDPLGEGLSMDLQMVVRSYKLGLRRLEFPVQEVPRLDGETHFKALPTGIKLLKYMWGELGRRRPLGTEHALSRLQGASSASDPAAKL